MGSSFNWDEAVEQVQSLTDTQLAKSIQLDDNTLFDMNKERSPNQSSITGDLQVIIFLNDDSCVQKLV